MVVRRWRRSPWWSQALVRAFKTKQKNRILTLTLSFFAMQCLTENQPLTVKNTQSQMLCLPIKESMQLRLIQIPFKIIAEEELEQCACRVIEILSSQIVVLLRWFLLSIEQRKHRPLEQQPRGDQREPFQQSIE